MFSCRKHRFYYSLPGDLLSLRLAGGAKKRIVIPLRVINEAGKCGYPVNADFVNHEDLTCDELCGISCPGYPSSPTGAAAILRASFDAMAKCFGHSGTRRLDLITTVLADRVVLDLNP